jgi:phage gpG-like protein
MITIDMDDRAVLARFTALPSVMRAKIVETTGKLGLDLQHQVQADKLSGQVLRVRTNTLRSSIEESGDAVSARVGTSIFYGAIHEFGVSRSWLIEAKSAKALRFEVGGQTLFRRRVTHPPLPERSFLCSALRDMMPAILAAYKGAITGVTD